MLTVVCAGSAAATVSDTVCSAARFSVCDALCGVYAGSPAAIVCLSGWLVLTVTLSLSAHQDEADERHRNEDGVGRAPLLVELVYRRGEIFYRRGVLPEPHVDQTTLRACTADVHGAHMQTCRGRKAVQG